MSIRVGLWGILALALGACTEPDPDFIEPDSGADSTNDTNADGTESGDGTTTTNDGTDTADGTDTGNCGANETLCGAECVNTQDSKNHCGMCDNKCQGPSRCVDGMCD